MNALVLHPTSNSRGRHDVTGAFAPGARELCRVYGIAAPHAFDNTLPEPARERAVLSAIHSAARPLELLAYFGHGVSDGLSSAGFRGPMEAAQFCRAVKTVAADSITILLYACSAANSFASRIAGGVGSNCEVYAHTTSGHSYKNPYLKRFPPGEWVIAPGDRQWPKWVQRLRHTSLWAVFPFLTDE